MLPELLLLAEPLRLRREPLRLRREPLRLRRDPLRLRFEALLALRDRERDSDMKNIDSKNV